MGCYGFQGLRWVALVSVDVAQRALALLDQAFAANPSLQFEYRTDQAELQRLVSGG